MHVLSCVPRGRILRGGVGGHVVAATLSPLRAVGVIMTCVYHVPVCEALSLVSHREGCCCDRLSELIFSTQRLEDVNAE